MGTKQDTWKAMTTSQRELLLEAKIQQYESFLHKINTACTACNNKAVQQLVSNANSWSYAHRAGNGMPSDEEQQEMVDRAFDKLCDVDWDAQAREFKAKMAKRKKDSVFDKKD